MTTKTKTGDLDWWAISQAAQGLGVNTRRLVALHDADSAITWALDMSRAHVGPAALSYYELAAMLGHRDPKVTAAASLDYNELLLAVEKLQAAIRVKADEEKAAAKEASRQAEKAAAEQTAALEAIAELTAEPPADDEAVADAV